jgi:hypothetical protein
MSGGETGLNSQGIKRAKVIREGFTLADPGDIVCGGDYVSFQVTIADAVYNDNKLREDLQKTRTCIDCLGEGCEECDGTGTTSTKIHGLMGTFLFPPMTYDEILASKDLPNELDRYTRSKNGVFGLLFGGTEYTLANRVGVSEEEAIAAYKRWTSRYKEWGKERQRIFDSFCSMRQPKGIGTKVEWHDAADYIESLFGFRRFFNLENRICKALFDLATDPPKEWLGLNIRVTRREREQSVSGAVRSSLYAAAFAVQAANMRAAGNHVIQATEADITKRLQAKIWDLQPAGINEWLVRPFQSHDEIITTTIPGYPKKIRSIVNNFVKEMSEIIPLIKIDWSDSISSWAEK